MTYALIANGLVVQIADAEFPVHESLIWVDAGQATVGWTYANGTLTAPETDTPPAATP